MHTTGRVAPETEAEFEEWYEAAGSAARTVTRELAKAMDFDGEEYDRRVTNEVVETARDALFASLLSVTVGTRAEFEDWRDDYDGAVHLIGSENVDRVAWHAVPFADEAVAATFQDRTDAAVDTLRRQAFGRIYREYR